MVYAFSAITTPQKTSPLVQPAERFYTHPTIHSKIFTQTAASFAAITQ